MTENNNTNNGGWSDDKIRQVIKDRARGLYNCEDTRDEMMVAWNGKSEKDVAICINMRMGAFNIFTKEELDNQIKNWRKVKCVVRDYNIKELELKDGTKAWCFVMQPPNLAQNCNLCPLGMAHGLMVSGYTYFVKNKEVAEYVVSQMKRRKANFKAGTV